MNVLALPYKHTTRATWKTNLVSEQPNGNDLKQWARMIKQGLIQ